MREGLSVVLMKKREREKERERERERIKKGGRKENEDEKEKGRINSLTSGGNEGYKFKFEFSIQTTACHVMSILVALHETFQDLYRFWKHLLIQRRKGAR